MKKFNIFLMAFLIINIIQKAGAVSKVSGKSGSETTEKIEIDVQKKLQEVKHLVDNAAEHLSNAKLELALRDFNYNRIWFKGDMSVFVLDDEGTFFASGDNQNLIWKDIDVLRNFGKKKTHIIEEMLYAGLKGSRISYPWDNGNKSSYVKVVEKDGQRFIVGSGFFPQNAQYRVKQLVKTAANFFHTQGSKSAFSLISDPKGSFVQGNIYVFACNLNGICVAHGHNPGLIGQNLINLKDSRNKYIIKNLIKIAKTKKSGWLNYIWHNELKRTYVELVTDAKTKKQYFIAAGFYPNINDNTITSFVDKGIKHMQDVGPVQAFSDFTSLSSDYTVGSLQLYVYDLKGKCLANGNAPELVGQNLINKTDQDGKEIVKDMIELAKTKKNGFLFFRENNSQAVAYISRADMPKGKFIVGAQYYPESKEQSTKALVNHAVEYLSLNSAIDSFKEFSKPMGPFIRGDLSVFVYNSLGVRFVNGVNKKNLWRNFLRVEDQDGHTPVADMIGVAINGGGWVQYRTRNALRRVYVQAVNKEMPNGKTEILIVGSGYFL